MKVTTKEIHKLLCFCAAFFGIFMCGIVWAQIGPPGPWCANPLLGCESAQNDPFCGPATLPGGSSGGSPPNPPQNPPSSEPPCCGPDGCKKCSSSPGFLRSGNYAFSVNDFQIPTRGFPLSVSRNYQSNRTTDGYFGMGWTSNVTLRLLYVTYLYQLPSTYYREAILVMPDGKEHRFRENMQNGTFTSPDGSFDSLVKSGSDFILKLANGKSEYRFDQNGKLLSMKDDYGNLLNFTYLSGTSKIDRITDGTGSGRYLVFDYYPNGRIWKIRDAINRKVEYFYGPVPSDSYLTGVKDQENREINYAYGFVGRFNVNLMTKISRHMGTNQDLTISDIDYYSYNAVDSYPYNRLKSYTDQGEKYTYEYNPDNELYPTKTKRKDLANNTWTYTYNSANGLVTRREGSSGAAITLTEYDVDGLVLSSTEQFDGKSIKTCYEYSNGLLTSMTQDCSAVNPPVKFVYTYGDPTFPHKVTEITPKYVTGPNAGLPNRDWQAWAYAYWPTGSLAPGALKEVKRIKSDGLSEVVTSYEYNNKGQVTRVLDGAGLKVVSYTYDATTGDQITASYPKNSDAGLEPLYTYTREALTGRISSVTDANGKITSYTYDDLDRILTVTLPKPAPSSPLNFTMEYIYDDWRVTDGLIYTIQRDPNFQYTGKKTEQGFDQFGRLIKSKDAFDKITTFTYSDSVPGSLNPKGVLEIIKDANDNETKHRYDVFRRLTETTFPNGDIESYTYFGDGTIKTKTDRKDQTITFTYDNFKRLIEKRYPNNATIAYDYFKNGNVTQHLRTVTDNLANETHQMEYDSSYRLQWNQQGTRGRIDYAYNSVDRLNSYAVQGGPSTTYTYFDDGSVKSVNSTLLGNPIQYTYLLTGQYGTITFPNNQFRNFSYDDQGRLTQIHNANSSGVATYSYGYDVDNYTGSAGMLGQRSSMTATVTTQGFNNHQTKYYFDYNYQLKKVEYPNVVPFSAEVHSWTYDDIGNRLTNTVNTVTKNYTYYKNGANPKNGQRLKNDGVITPDYAYDDNGNIVTAGVYSYSWDYEKRLVSITASGQPTIAYKYDYLGRRISKKIGTNPETTYLYDGQNLVGERGAVTADYVFGPGIDEPLIQRRGTSVYYYNVDGLGSTTMVNFDAIVPTHNNYVYDAWGVTRSTSGTIPNNFGYTSREFGEAGLMYYRARYYNPNIGRFVSEDPLGTTTQDPAAVRFKSSNLRGLLFSRNYYSYATQNPIFNTDPSGMESKKCCPECSGGYWTGFGYDVGAFFLFGGNIAEYTLKCATDTKMKVHIITFCKGLARGWSKAKGWGLQLVASTNVIGVHCFNAPCPEEFGGYSVTTGGGKGYALLGGSVSVDQSLPGGPTCITTGLGIGIGAGVNISGCETYVD